MCDRAGPRRSITAVDELTAYATALGVSAAAGLNAWIPLLTIGLLSRFTGVIELTGDWDLLEQTWLLVVLAAIGVADFVGDKVPAVDHVLHAAGTVIAPIAGTVAALAATGGEASPVVVAVLAIFTAEFAHGTRAALRPVSTVGTAGAATPAVSAAEDTGSVALSVVALAAPVLAALAVLAAMVAAAFSGRALWRRWSARRS